MEAILFELYKLEELGLTPTRILVSPTMLDVLRRSHEQLTGVSLPIKFREGVFNGLPFITIDNLTTNFEIAVQPIR